MNTTPKRKLIEFAREKLAESSKRNHPVNNTTLSSDNEYQLGNMLRGHRASIGYSLIDINRITGLPPYLVLAIENGDLDAFPNPRLIGSFVLQYAKFLGMDAKQVYRRFCTETGYSNSTGKHHKFEKRFNDIGIQEDNGEAKKLTEQITDRINSGLSYFLSGSFLVGIGSVTFVSSLLVLVAFLSWTIYNQLVVAPFENSVGTNIPQDQANTVASSNDQESNSVSFNRLGWSFEARLSPMIDILPSTYQEASVNQGMLENQSQIISRYESPTPIPLLEALSVPVIEITEVQKQENKLLETINAINILDNSIALIVGEDVWVRVYHKDNSVILERILQPGSSYMVPDTGQERILRTGNANSLYVLFQNSIYGPLGEVDVLDNISLEPETIIVNYKVVNDNELPSEVQQTLLATMSN